MSDPRKPVASITFRRDAVTYSVLSIWKSQWPGTYSLSRDKGTEKYPAISIIEVLKAFAAGDGFVNVRVPSEADNRGGGSSRAPRDEPTPDARDFGDDIPF